MNFDCKKVVTSERGIYAVAFLGFLLFYCIYLSPELVKGKLLAPGDGLIFYYPVTREWSLWVDNVLSGYPAFGDPQYILWYPLRWLGLSYNSLVISAYVLASFFAFGFVKQLTGNSWAGIFAGIVFGMSGSMTAHIGHLTIIHAAAWLPLVTWATDRLVTRASVAWFLIGSSAVACMFLAGFPQIFVYGMLVATSFFLFRLLYLNRPHGAQVLKAVGLYFGMVSLGVLLAAVQVLPLIELSNLSVRRDMSYQGFVSYSLPLSHSVLLLFPNLFGDFTGYFGGFDLSAVAFYFGWSTLFLITLAIFAPHVRGTALFWIAIACISFTFALGDATPLAKIAYHLPLVGKLRVPSRALVVTDFAAAILGGLGLANLLSGSVAKKQFFAACATFAAITFVAFAAVLIGYSALVKLAAEKGVALSKAAFANESVYLPLIFAAATMVSILIVVWSRGRASGSAMCALLIADLASSNWHGVGRGYFVDRASLRMDAQWRMVQEELLDSRGRLLLLGSAFTFTPGSPNLNLLYGITQASGYGPLMLKRYSDVTGIVTSGDLPTPPASPAVYQMLNVEWGMIGAEIALFGAGCGAVGVHHPINVEIPPGFKPTRIRLVSLMACSTNIEQAMPVLRIDVNDASGSVASLTVQAGEHTAEWAIDRPDVQKAVRHTRARVHESFNADDSAQAHWRGHWYDATLPIPDSARAAPIHSLTVRGLLDDAIINIREMALIDDASGRQLLVPLEALRVVQPPNWDEMIAMTTGGYLAKFRKSLGRAWLVDDVRRADRQAIVRAFHDGHMPNGTSFDPARLAFIEETPPHLGSQSSVQLNRRVDIVSLKPGRWVMEVQAPAASFLVISQTNYPGWRVNVNDEPAHLYQTNYAFQGVAVPPGHSRIVLEFWPASLTLGAGITLFALVLAGALLVWDLHRRVSRQSDNEHRLGLRRWLRPSHGT